MVCLSAHHLGREMLVPQFELLVAQSHPDSKLQREKRKDAIPAGLSSANPELSQLNRDSQHRIHRTIQSEPLDQSVRCGGVVKRELTI